MTDRIDLEVLTRQPAQGRRPTPLLFVHGAYSSARQWEAFFCRSSPGTAGRRMR